MFGSLLGGKFSNKCKHCVKCIRSRVGMIRRKKHAMLNYLRRDVAELLSNGHDTNAFGRIEALIFEINHASCYDMIELYCECILQLLPSLQKQRECPEEAMEAMSTLIFAAARFSDLPELCDLRTVFTERYGSEMESSINGEFVEKLQKKSFSTEKKLQLMQHIAEEFSVPWDSKAFQQKLYNQQRLHAENWRNAAVKGRKEAVIDVGGDREAPPRNHVQEKQVQPEPRDVQYKLRSGNNDRHTDAENWRNAAIKGRKDAAIYAGGDRELPSNGRWQPPPPPTSLVQKEQVHPEPRDIHVISSTREEPGLIGLENAKVLPSIKPKGRRNGTRKDACLNEGAADCRSPMAREGPGLIGLEKPIVGQVISRDVKAVDMIPPYTKLNGVKNETLINRLPPYTKPNFKSPSTANDDDIELTNVPIDGSNPAENDMSGGGERPKPFSVRRKHPKIPVVTENEDLVRKEGRREEDQHASRPRREHRKHGSRSAAAYDRERDEEEQAMDRLLVHFSKKGTSKSRTRTRVPPVELVIRDHDGNGRVYPGPKEPVLRRPDRISSLPSEPTTPVPEAGAGRGPARATSMQPHMLRQGEGLVHPRLPDYDELAARFIALKKT